MGRGVWPSSTVNRTPSRSLIQAPGGGFLLQARKTKEAWIVPHPGLGWDPVRDPVADRPVSCRGGPQGGVRLRREAPPLRLPPEAPPRAPRGPSRAGGRGGVFVRVGG